MIQGKLLNSLRPRQNGRLFADDIFKCIFLNESVRISITISLKFVPKGLFNNIPALVPIMAWHRLGDKPLSEAMMVKQATHMCVTRPQWVKWWSGSLSEPKIFCMYDILWKYNISRNHTFWNITNSTESQTYYCAVGLISGSCSLHLCVYSSPDRGHVDSVEPWQTVTYFRWSVQLLRQGHSGAWQRQYGTYWN